MKKILFVSALLFALQTNLSALSDSVIVSLNKSDRMMIAEAFKINGEYSEKLWKGWSEVPFAVLLVTEQNEFLIRHPKPSDDFKLIEYDSLLKSNVLYRKRVFDTHFLATFPAVNGISTVVVGTSDSTGKDPVAWIITLLHEHFHQLQNYQADYFKSVDELNLSGGDESGMWMLNYPFPYEDENVNTEYDSLKKALVRIFKNKDARSVKPLFENYRKFRDIFAAGLNENDYKYFSFQIWQEGIARYTELKLSMMLAENEYKFPETILMASEFKSAKEFYTDLYTNQLNLLNGLKFAESKRNCFYPFGAFEGLLLDRINPKWRNSYFLQKFFIEKYYLHLDE